MFAFTRPKLLVWRDDVWQITPFAKHIHTPPVATDTPFEEAAMQLSAFKKSHRRYPICLPPEWLVHGDHSLPESFPDDLYPLVAHTYGAYYSALLDHDRVTGYVCQQDCLTFAVMSRQQYEAISVVGHQGVYSDALIRAVPQKRWSVIRHLVKPLEPFAEDYIERQRGTMQQRRMGGTMMLISVVTLGCIGYCLSQLPTLETVPAPHYVASPQSHTLLDGLRYLRSLPPTVRLDRVILDESRVKLMASGQPQDLALWQQHWPDNLPPLQVAWQSGGARALD